MNRFVVFEGIDCCGKTTQLRRLEKTLLTHNIPVVTTREPGGTPLAEKIRDLILEQNLDPLTELMLLSAARHDHVENLIKPALQQGKIVLCDRFYGSTLAYQCYAKGLDKHLAMQVTTMVIGHTKPGVTILLDIPPEVAKQRRANRGGQSHNHYDERSMDFYQSLQSAFLEISNNEPGWHIINANQDEASITSRVYDIIRDQLNVNHIVI